MKFWTVNIIVLFICTGWVLNVFADDGESLRLVSVNGALTEIVYELGSQDVLVGVDTTSMYPTEATQLPQVGYQRNLSVEGILSLRPTHIIASAEAGPPVVLEQLKNSGIKILKFKKEHSIEAVIERVLSVALLLDKKVQGDILINEIQQQFEEAKLLVSQFQQRASGDFNQGVNNIRYVTANQKRLMFLLAVGSGSPLVAGSETAADAMIQLAGAKNVFESFSGYKPVSAEAIVKAAPDTILVVTHSNNERSNIINKVLKTPGVELTSAGKNKNIHVLNGLRFLGFGPRIGEAILDLGKYLYSDGSTDVVRNEY